MVEDWIERIPVKRAWQYQQIALVRQHLYLTGETHRILMRASDEIGKRLMRGGKNEPISSLQAFGVMSAASEIVNDILMTEWLPTFQALRKEAGSLAFGTLAVQMGWLAGQAEALKGQALTPSPSPIRMGEGRRTLTRELGESKIADGVFEDQLALLMDAAGNRVLRDGMNLSSRIWQLTRQSTDGINQLVMEGLQSQWGAWDLAKKIEGYLGAGRDCPRWTRTRLYGLDKGQIAGGIRTGLKTGDECAGQGVAYNALRMARNEIQTIHHLATDQVMGQIPWIEQEKVNLSGGHPPLGCICEQIVVGGENADGVYPKGSISLPLHVQCMCYKTAVQMEPEQFTSNLRGWMRGEQSWGAMDRFAEYVNLPAGELVGASLANNLVSQALGVWIFGKEDDILGRILQG